MICGNPFMSQGIIPNPVDKCIEVRSQSGIPKFIPWRSDSIDSTPISSTYLLRPPEPVTIFPGDYIEMDAPQELSSAGDCEVLVTQRVSSNS